MYFNIDQRMNHDKYIRSSKVYFSPNVKNGRVVGVHRIAILHKYTSMGREYAKVYDIDTRITHNKIRVAKIFEARSDALAFIPKKRIPTDNKICDDNEGGL